MTLKRKKVLFITTGIITLVVAITVALLFEIRAFKPQIEAAASNAVGMDVRIRGRLGITLVPGFGISMQGVSVMNKGVDVVTIEKMTIGLELIPLMRREVLISRVELVKPVFSIVRYRNGMFNLGKPSAAPSKKPFAAATSTISQGRLVFADKTSGKKIEAEGLDLTLRNLSYGGADNAEPFKNISFTGDARCGTLKINNLVLTNVVMKTAGGNGIFDINPVTMSIFGGNGKAGMHVDVTGGAPRYRVIGTLNRVRIEDLVRKFSPEKTLGKTIEGLTDFSADLTAKGRSMDEVKRSLSGDVSLKGENLMLYSIDIDALIAKFEQSQNFNLVDVGAFFLAGPFGPVLSKSYNFGSLYEESRGGKGSIRKLVSIWKVKRGIAEATDVALASDKHRIAMKGGLNLINDRFVNVTVAVLDKRGCAVYSQKVHGPFSKPRIEKVSVLKSISGSVLNALGDAWKLIQGKECTAFYSGSVAQPE
jgi:AsmA protein